MHKYFLFINAMLLTINVYCQSNVTKTNIVANKSEITKKITYYNKCLDFTLLSEAEMKKIIKYAIENYSDDELAQLQANLAFTKYYKYRPLIIKERMNKASGIEKSSLKCQFAYVNYLNEWKESKYKSNFNPKKQTIIDMQNAVEEFPSNCTDYYKLCNLATATSCFVDDTYKQKNDLIKAWEIFKKSKSKIHCQQTPEGEISVNKVLNVELDNLSQYLSDKKKRNKMKTNINTLSEIQEYIEESSEKDFMNGNRSKTKLLNIISKYKNELIGNSLYK